MVLNKELTEDQIELVTKHIPDAINFRRKFFKCNHEIEDELDSLAQDALILAAKKFDKTKNTKFTTYLLYWIRERIYDYYEKRKKDFDKLSLLKYKEQFNPSELPKRFECFDKKLIKELLDKNLTEKQYNIYKLYYGLSGLEPMNKQKIAEHLNVSCSYINIVISRVHEIFKNKLTIKAMKLKINPEDF